MMADYEEVDILGDIDNDASLLTPDDDPELPSKNVHLLPEFSQHPWLLEQDWNLDHCSDERSRAAIEKLLQEEQLYYDGHFNKTDTAVKTKVEPCKSKQQEKVSNVHATKRKSSWNKAEQQLFFEGLEKYGRRWSKIAESIPSKTRQQVKNFALHHLNKKKANVPEEKNVDCQKNIIHPTSDKTEEEKPKEVVMKMRHASNSTSEDEEIDIEDTSDTDSPSLALTENITTAKQTTCNNSLDIPGDSSPPNCDSLTAMSPAKCTKGETSSTSNSETQISSSLKSCNESTQYLDISQMPEIDKVQEMDTALGASDTEHYEHEVTLPNKDSVCCEQVSLCSTSDSLTVSHTSEQFGEDVCDQRSRDLDDSHSSESETESTSENDLPVNIIDVSEELHPDEFGLVKSDGSIVYLSNPDEEYFVNMQQFSSQEQEVFSEFFSGRSGTKNPERYLRIRNHILDLWKKSKPSYLKKTAVRHGLRNCGDVNCLGRVHAYLEQLGAINFGCEQAQYNHPMKQPHAKLPKIKLSKEQHEAMVMARKESMRPRKRRAESGLCGGMADTEGTTIVHNVDGSISEKVTASIQKKSPAKKTPQVFYDPFKLVPCQSFSTEHEAPFRISIQTPAIMVMDMHAHLSKTEVIGLLGGEYNQEQYTLVITSAEPCDSLSTGMQCEMDPVSQTQACERILAQQQKVVGWYHSHPVFDANPSVRDMETQMRFQEWFATGGNAFVGIIISPFNQTKTSLYSDITCLVVEKNVLEDSLVPYKFDYTTTMVRCCKDVAHKVERLAEKYVLYPKRVDLLSPFKTSGNVTCLEKMLLSLGSHCRSASSSADVAFSNVRSMLEGIFKSIYEHCRCETV